MATELKLRRGTTAQHSTFTGAEAEVTVDTDKETVVVHDGSTAGGFPLATEALSLEGRKDEVAQGFIQREGTRGDLDVDLAVAIELNLLGAPVAGGYYAGLIDTTGDGSIQPNDDYQSGQRYALIVSDKSLEGGRGSSPASGLPTGDLEWDTQDRGGEAGAFTRWNGLDATNVIIAKNDTSYEAHDFIEAVRSQYPAATTPGGSEWYLPAMDELELLYRNFKPNNADNDTRDFPRNFPGSNPSGKNLSSVPEGFNYENNPRIPDVTFLDLFKEGNAQAIDLERYWSTTDADEGDRAWNQSFTDSGSEGLQVAGAKVRPDFSVRPVRRVVLDDSNDTKNRSGNYNINGSITAHGLNTDGGDVSFTEDTGTTPKFVWDASAEQLDLDGTLNVDSGTLFVDSANNRVGVGTSSPSEKLEVNGNIIADGVYLGGTGSANKLDDYEEGTWTPVVSSGSNSFSSKTHYYRKIGNLVFVSFDIRCTDITNTIEVRITNLPFSVSNDDPFSTNPVLQEFVPFDHVAAEAPNSTSIIQFRVSNTNGNSDILTYADLSDTGNFLRGTLHYLTDS